MMSYSISNTQIASRIETLTELLDLPNPGTVLGRTLVFDEETLISDDTDLAEKISVIELGVKADGPVPQIVVRYEILATGDRGFGLFTPAQATSSEGTACLQVRKLAETVFDLDETMMENCTTMLRFASAA